MAEGPHSAGMDPLDPLQDAAGAWVWDVPGERLYTDASFAHLCGLDAAAAKLGLPTSAFLSGVAPEDRLRVKIAVGGMLHGAEVFNKQYRVRGGDGMVRWVSARGRAERSEHGELTRFVGSLVDITDQKRVEEQLRIAQTAGGVGSFEHTDGFGTVEVSEQFCRLLGLQAADALPVRTVNALVREGDPPIIRTRGVAGAQDVTYSEQRIARADSGEERWLARRGEYRKDGVGGGGRFIGVIYDITAAKASEAKLRELNRTLEEKVQDRTRERDGIWNRARDLFFVISPDGVFRAVNPAWTHLLGHRQDELVGTRLAALLHPDDLVASRVLAGRIGRGERIEDVNVRILGKDGGFRWINWTVFPEGGDFYGMGRDVTERLQLEEQLRQSQKMEAVGQLTGGLAHDFNNLLTGITGSLELLENRIRQGRTNEVERYVAAAQGAAKRAAALTHRLLAFSRRQTLAPKSTDVNRLTAGMEDLIRRTIGPSVELEAVKAAGLWNVLVDPSQLENALLNLCINARDAMPNGGKLTVETANRWVDEKTADERDLPPGQYVSLCVSDNGSGMSPEVQARAFDPFFTTKPIGQGTGLGLSMIYGFARQSGGEARIYSEVGQGTMVCLYLPRNLGSAEDDSLPVAIESHQASAGETVLIVDDEPTVRMLIAEVLQELGYRALEAPDGVTALKIVQTGTRIDLLVTDVGLPGGMNGRQVADAVRAERSAMKVLFITGYAENAVLSHGHLDPGMEILTKPFTIESLATRVSALVADRR